MGHQMVAFEGRLYAIGGRGGADVLIYDPDTGWSRGAPMPQPRDHLAAASSTAGSGGRFAIYAMGRDARDPATASTCTTSPTDTWSDSAPDLPMPMSAMAAGVMDDGIHVVGRGGPADDRRRGDRRALRAVVERRVGAGPAADRDDARLGLGVIDGSAGHRGRGPASGGVVGPRRGRAVTQSFRPSRRNQPFGSIRRSVWSSSRVGRLDRADLARDAQVPAAGLPGLAHRRRRRRRRSPPTRTSSSPSLLVHPELGDEPANALAPGAVTYGTRSTNRSRRLRRDDERLRGARGDVVRATRAHQQPLAGNQRASSRCRADRSAPPRARRWRAPTTPPTRIASVKSMSASIVQPGKLRGLNSSGSPGTGQ